MPSAPADYHFLHITVTRETNTIAQGKAGARQVETYGYSSPAMVSYQDLVTNEGRYFQGQDYGTKGTHTVNDKGVSGYPRDLNLRGYATALMQNVQDPVTDIQVDVVAKVFAARELTGWVRRGAPILPHRMFAWKSCPGDKAMARLPEIARLRDQYVKDGLGGFVVDKQTENKIRTIFRQELDQFLADFADELKIDVGKKHKWSLDTFLRTVFNRQQRIERQQQADAAAEEGK